MGGNLRLKKHFSEYDLLEEAPQMRYRTWAADYYRRMLRASASGESFLEEPPVKDQGRGVIEEINRTSEEITANNNPQAEQDVLTLMFNTTK